jgi:hypothetical protein
MGRLGDEDGEETGSDEDAEGIVPYMHHMKSIVLMPPVYSPQYRCSIQ